MSVRRVGSQRNKKIRETINDTTSFASDVNEDGIKTAIDNVIENKVLEGIKTLVIRKFGKHPALTLLPEYIKSLRGYGPRTYIDETSQVLEDVFGPQEEHDEFIDDLLLGDDTKFLDDIIDDELTEIDNIIDQLEPKDLDELLDDLEDIPDSDENDIVEENSGNDNQKCTTISLNMGEEVVTFNTCDGREDPPDRKNNNTRDYSDLQPPISGIHDYWCPIINLQGYNISGYHLITGAPYKKEEWSRTWRYNYIGYVPNFSEEYKEWKDREQEKKTIFWENTLFGYKYVEVISYSVVWHLQVGRYLSGWTDIEPYQTIVYDDEEWPRGTTAFLGHYRYNHILYPNPSPWAQTLPCRGTARNPTRQPPSPNKTKPPEIIREMPKDKDCCDKLLVLLTKIAKNTGAIPNSNSKYPDGVTPNLNTSKSSYGYPAKVPKSWLKSGEKGDLTIYNTEQLLLLMAKMLGNNHEALASEELVSKGIEYPNNWVLPNGTGSSIAYTIIELFEVLARQADHLGVHPFETQIADLNPAKPGNQTLRTSFNNATHVMKSIFDAIKETDGDQAAALNLQLRQAVLLGRVALTVASMSETIMSMADSLGLETVDDIEVFKNFPFDFTLGTGNTTSGKGFGDNSKNNKPSETSYRKILEQLGSKDEEGAEAVLEAFLNARHQPFITKKLQANLSLLEAIINGQNK